MTKPEESKVPVGLGVALAELGVPVSTVLTRAELPARLFELPVARLPVALYFALWRSVREVSGDPNIGLRLAQLVRADQTEPLFLAVMSAHDLGAAIAAVASYKRMLSPEVLAVATTGEETSLSYVWPSSFGVAPQSLLDAELAFVVEIARRATRELGLAPLRVTLATAALDAGAQHADFFRCPILLGAPANSVVFRATDVARRFYTHNPAMLAALDPYLAANTPASSTIGQVRAVIAERLRGQRPTLQSVAKELAMSTRTLQRALGEEQTSFRALLDEVRGEHARGYLRGTSYSDPEIAYLLGFEDSNSFYRAFRAWNGVSPSEFRRKTDTH